MQVYMHFTFGGPRRRMARALVAFLMLLSCTGWISAQTVTGTVVDETGLGLIGATVLVEGTTSGTVTDIDGNFSINADSDDVLLISYTGYLTQRVDVGNQSNITINMNPDVAVLDQVVVTGYSQQRKGDITGAVAVLDAEELTSVAASSVNQQLEGRATGVQVSTSGSPGDGTNIRIRGISSFTSNDPLIVVDGVPQLNNFLNNINPNDIESVQILKDASASSIYGTRALNGVLIITTKKGKSGKPKITYDAYYGIQDHERGFDDILIQSSQDYANIFWDTYANVGETPPSNIYGTGNRPVIPTYIFPARNEDGSEPNIDESTYSYPNNLIMRANPEGTDWWNEVFSPAPIMDHTLAISGGTDAGTYRISANYQDQEGTMNNTFFQRVAVRANSQWKLGRVTIGENLNLSRVTQNAPGSSQSEQSTIMQIVKAQPIIPVYDVSGVNFASGKSNGLSNGTNPVARTVYDQHDIGEYDAILGNFFANVELIDGLTFRTNVGINYSVGGAPNWSNPTFENSEPTTINGFSEFLNRSYNWVWTNTLTYNRNFNDRHDLTLLAGYESLRERFRGINGSFSQYFLSDVSTRYLNAGLANPETDNVSSFGSEHTLLSQFARVDYTLNNKYLLSATVRRDGSSRFGPENRYGVFPAASFGWRVSSEPFMEGTSNWLTDLKFRIGYGIVGNENIGNYRFVNQFGGGTGRTFYAINGGNTLATGYTATAFGDPSTGWEEKATLNMGIDATLIEGKVTFVLDVYRDQVNDLLFNPGLPLTAGTPAPPFRNVGDMQNTGFDLALGWRPEVGALKFNINANISHYQNEIVTIAGDQTEFFGRGGPGTRIGNIQINRVGSPIGSFYGFVQDGIWQSQAEIDAADALDGDPTTSFQPNAAPGRFRWADVNGIDPETGELTGQPDGIINDADIDIIGSPHPDFTAGLNIGANYKNFDFTAFFFGSFGNDIFNAVQQFTIFRQFNTNASTRLLTETWTPDNPNAPLPALDINDTESRRPSSFYVEDGSYVRLKQLQVGYTFPQGLANGVLSNLRVYLQAQNLFTITDYSGLDPSLSSFGTGNADADDLFMGVDIGNYPTTRIIMVGVNAGF